jgi:hypothetical protein
LQFNHVNKLSVIARAHQLVQEGFKYMFDEQLVTVWSAPNYCYRCGNMAAIMTVHEDGSRTFNVYDAAPENDRDKGQGRRLVSGSTLPSYATGADATIEEQHAIFCVVSLCLYYQASIGAGMGSCGCKDALRFTSHPDCIRIRLSSPSGWFRFRKSADTAIPLLQPRPYPKFP